MAVTFNGTTSGLLRTGGLANLVDGRKGTFSCWVKRAATGVQHVLLANAETAVDVLSGFVISISTTNVVSITGRDTSDTDRLIMTSSSTITDTEYHHVVATWDLSVGVGTGKLYIDRTDVTVLTTASTAADIDYTRSRWGVGFSPALTPAYFNGSLYDVFFDPTTFVDLTSASVLSGFVASDGLTDRLVPGPHTGKKPVGYDYQATKPTGVQPAIFLSGGPGSFHVNKGSGGDFTADTTLADERGPKTYRESARYATPGVRWFDSHRNGFSYPKSEMIRDPRDGKRIHYTELDAPSGQDRRQFPPNLQHFVFSEEDNEDIP